MKKSTKKSIVKVHKPKDFGKLKPFIAQKEYWASIKVMGKIYIAGGATLSDAITSLKPEGRALGMSIIIVKNGDKTQEKILPRIATARLFAPSKMIREVALKNVIGRFSI